MLHVNNLMIGDWVNYRPGWKDEETGQIEFECGAGFPVKIEMLYFCRNEGLVQYNDGENDGIEAADYELFPIPLTPEILEKNGFDVSDPEVSIYRFEEDGQVFRFCLRRMYDKDNHPNGYSFYAFNVLAIIDSVHQLQHALRLCGIEKEIEI